MKMFRLLTGLTILATLTLAGCGDQSPDFTPQLKSIAIAPAAGTPLDTTTNPSTVGLGQTVQFVATGSCTTPPGSSSNSQPCGAGKVSWSVDNSNYGSITSSGLFTAGPSQTPAGGMVTITAAGGGQTPATYFLKVGPPTLQKVVIVNSNATNTQITTLAMNTGSSATVQALGIYSDNSTPRNISNGYVTWASSNPSSVTVSSPASAPGASNPNVTTTLTATQTTGNSNVSATVATTDGSTPPAPANLAVTVSVSTFSGLAPAVNLNPAQIAPMLTSQATAVGVYKNGTQQNLPNDGSTVTWSSGTPAIATINANTGIATGVTKGQSTITATLTSAFAAANPGSSPTTSTAVLTVTDPVCPTPFLASNGATVTSAQDPLCLLCSTSNGANIIDADFTNFATTSVPVGLLGVLGVGSASVTVKATSSFTPASGQSAGFVIGRPAGQLVLAELLSQITVSTSLGGVATGDTSSTSTPLRLDLLGNELIGNQAALASVLVTKPFDSITLTFNSGLVTALSNLQVYQACATAVPPQ